MATYYVSAQRGNNGYSGTSQSSPWLTLTYAVSHVVAGDTVYIGPGLYREKLTLATAGTVATPIKWCGDPTCAFLTLDNPGRVHITGYDADWLQTTGTVINCNDKNYNYFYDLTVDGSDKALYGLSGVEAYRCNFQGTIIAVDNGVALTECFVSGGQYGTANNCTNVRCVLTGGYYASYGCINEACLAIGGQCGFYGSYIYNCTAVGGLYGYYGSTNYNCAAYNNTYGFGGEASNTAVHNCNAVCCEYAFYGTNTGSPLVVSDYCYATACHNVQRGGGYESGTVTAGTAIDYDWYDLRKVMEPWLFKGYLNLGTSSYYATADILNRLLPQGSGVPDIGCWETSDYTSSFVSGDFQQYPPALKINRASEEIFYISAEASRIVQVQVQVKNMGTDMLLLPQLTLRGRGINTQTVSASAPSDTWETITLTTSTTEDAVLELLCVARDTAVGAYAYFSDFSVSISTIDTPLKYGSCTTPSGSATLVQAAGTVIPTGATQKEYGQPIAGMYSGNFAWLQNNTTKFAITFVAPKSGNLASIANMWKTTTGYGTGDYGSYEVQLCEDNAGVPGTVKTTITVPTILSERFNNLPITGTLVAGTRYHLTIRNNHASPASNWSSPNTMQRQMFTWPTDLDAGITYPPVKPDDAVGGYYPIGGACQTNASGSWVSWHSEANPFGAGIGNNAGNASHVPLVLVYADGTKWGDPYYTALYGSGAKCYGSTRYGEIFLWTHATMTITRIGAYFDVPSATSPADSLYYRIESTDDAGFTPITGTLSTPYNSGTQQAWWDATPGRWNYVNLPAGVIFTNNKTYRISFYSPGSSSTIYYHQPIPYSDNNATYCNPMSFGTTNAVAQSSTNGGSTWNNITTACVDMAISIVGLS